MGREEIVARTGVGHLLWVLDFTLNEREAIGGFWEEQ